jgi:hypothetical protein
MIKQCQSFLIIITIYHYHSFLSPFGTPAAPAALCNTKALQHLCPDALQEFQGAGHLCLETSVFVKRIGRESPIFGWSDGTRPGKLTKNYGTSPFFYGKTHYKWPFSMAMLNYQRVPINRESSTIMGT